METPAQLWVQLHSHERKLPLPGMGEAQEGIGRSPLWLEMNPQRGVEATTLAVGNFHSWDWDKPIPCVGTSIPMVGC